MVITMPGSTSKGDKIEARAARWRDAFLAEATLERDLGRRTREAYKRDLDLLLAFLGRRERAVSETGTADLVAFLGVRRRAGDVRTTRARRAAALRSFFGWLKESGRIDRNPSLLLPAPAAGQHLPKALDRASARALVASPLDDAPPEPVTYRDHALLEILYGAGLRASEAADLKLKDIDRDGGFLRVFGKGRKERRVPLGAPGLAALETWLRKGRPKWERPDSSDRVFLTARGTPLSRDGVYRAVKGRVRALGLPDDVSPHTLRHTFATHLVQGGADLRAVQEMLGHASINTTQVYTTLADEHLRNAHKKHHPRG